MQHPGSHLQKSPKGSDNQAKQTSCQKTLDLSICFHLVRHANGVVSFKPTFLSYQQKASQN